MSGSLPVILKFEVPEHVNEILGFLKSVLKEIIRHMVIDHSLQQRIKLVLTELVTNTIKHGKNCNSRLELIIEQLQLTIKKTEFGSKLQFLSAKQMPFRIFDEVMEVSFSAENTHHIQTLDNYRFKFLNPFSTGLLLEGIPEHFGLYIITLASDSFFYEYDPNLSENRYIVSIYNQSFK